MPFALSPCACDVCEYDAHAKCNREGLSESPKQKLGKYDGKGISVFYLTLVHVGPEDG